MREFDYIGTSISGNIRGRITAITKSEAKTLLNSQGVVTSSIKSVRSSGNAAFWIFLKTLNILLSQKIKLSDALSVLTRHDDASLAKISDRILIKLSEGQNFHEILPVVFPKLDRKYFQLLKIGYRHADLNAAIELILTEHQNRKKFNGELTKALSYPLFVLFFSFVCLIVIFDTVLPEFKQFVGDAPTSKLQSFIMAGAGKAYETFVLIFWIAILSLGTFLLIRRNVKLFDLIILTLNKLPLISAMFKYSSQFQYIHALSLGLRLGADLSTATRLATDYVKNIGHKKRLLDIESKLFEGQTFSAALRETGLFNKLQIAQIEVAEQLNQLENIIQNLDSTIIEQRNHRLSVTSQLIGPLAIIMLGMIIFLVASVIITPIISLQNSIGF